MSGNGWCTHPDRQVSSDVRILVRKAELACRNAWGSDLWEDANAEAPAARPIKNDPIDLPMPSSPVSYDDEVTSVVNADQHQAPRHLEDEVVEQSTISFDDYGDDEQDERRELLYRDTGKSIARARERSIQRRRQPVAPDDDVIIANGDATDEAIAEPVEHPGFAPDDFIEDETPSSESSVDDHDDALLSEGIRTPSPRARRLRRFREERNNLPKAENVTKVDPEADDVELEVPQSAAPERGRFDSIPEISADIELPLLRRTSSANTPEERPRRAATPEDSSYERALKRAHALNAAARAEENVERRRISSPAPITNSPAPAPAPEVHAAMPDLPEDEQSVSRQPLQPQPRRERPAPSPRQRVPEEQPPLEVERQGHEARPRPARQERPLLEARRSWWRGTRQAGQEPMPIEQEHLAFHAATADAPEASMAFQPVHHDLPSSPETGMDAPVEPGFIATVPVAFDLEREEDLESFRDRLFTAAPAEQGAPSQRSPIAMSRRSSRPVAPAPRQRRPVEIVPDQPEMSEAEPERFEAGQRAPRKDRPAREQRERRRHIEPQELLQQPEDAWYEPEAVHGFDVRDLVEPDTELLDMTITIAPEVPRACVTCRDYRPSEQAGRGWCTNSWAFTHRQMVNETDLACDSTIGCWWLPADEEVWLSDFEVAADATPRIDRLIAHLDPERRAVGN